MEGANSSDAVTMHGGAAATTYWRSSSKSPVVPALSITRAQSYDSIRRNASDRRFVGDGDDAKEDGALLEDSAMNSCEHDGVEGHAANNGVANVGISINAAVARIQNNPHVQQQQQHHHHPSLSVGDSDGSGGVVQKENNQHTTTTIGSSGDAAGSDYGTSSAGDAQASPWPLSGRSV